MFWADIIIKKPEFVKELPKDVIALEWGYESNSPMLHAALYIKSPACLLCVPRHIKLEFHYGQDRQRACQSSRTRPNMA